MNKKILLIEDNEAFLESLTRLLEHKNYEIIQANCGSIALDIFNQKVNDIDIIVMDLTLPRIRGLDLLDIFAQIDSTIPIITMSGYNYLARKVISKENVLGFLPKPFEFKELLDFLTTASYVGEIYQKELGRFFE